MRSGRWWWVWAWLPVAIAVAVIMRESTPLFSAENTSSWLRPIVERVLGHIADPVWETGHMLFRKSGHFTGYGITCVTFVRAWLLTLARRVDLSVRTWRWSSVGLAVVSTFLVASGDEWHQTFLPSRTGQFSDVMLDTVGAIVACAVVWSICWRRGARLRVLQ